MKNMTARDRLLAVLKGQPADRVPLLMEHFHYRTLDEVKDPGKIEIINRVKNHLHFWHPCEAYVNRYMVTPPQFMEVVKREEDSQGGIITTTRINTPKGPLTAITGRNPISSTTWEIKYPVESLTDIDKLRSIEWELPAGLAAPDLKKLPPEFETRGILNTLVSSPFVCIAGMMSFNYFFDLCIDEPDLVEELTGECMNRILKILDVFLEGKPIEYFWIGGCEWLTPPMGSPALYEQLVHQYEIPIIKKAREAGALVHIHCHGNIRSTLEKMIERGADFTEPVEPPPDGDITFAEAKAVAAGRITLGGNIEARILENGTPDEVEKAARAAFEGGKKRMIFQTTAGPLSAMTPKVIANYHRMLDVWEELSPNE
jgi:uroporphyrinogen-III decarboxylase